MKVEILSPPCWPYGTRGATAANIVSYELAQQFRMMGLCGGPATHRLTIWNSDALIKFGTDLPTVVYQGDYDGEPALCRLRDQSLFKEVPSLLRRSIRLAGIWRDQVRIRGHLKQAKALCHSSAANVERYKHPRSIYVGNTWPDLGGKGRQFSGNGRIKIIGHIGRLAATGSAYGLRFLRDMLPSLRQEMKPQPFDVHIIGDGELAPGIRDLATTPNVIMRGYVPDLDTELQSADVFCLFNNAGPYLAAYSRHFLAWSSGACLAVHSRSRLAIPEVSSANALVAETPQAMAWAIAEGCNKRALNRRIRETGYATYSHLFRPEHIAMKLVKGLEAI